MRKLLYSLFAVLFITGCSDDNDTPDEPDQPEKFPEVKISTSDDGKSIFEQAVFNLSVEGLESQTELMMLGGFYLSEFYDSIMWRIPDQNLAFKCFSTGTNGFRFTYQWGTYFFLPGQWDTYISAYKDDEVVYEYKLPFSVKNDKDFLGYNWSDVLENDVGGMSYFDVFTEDMQAPGFATRREIHDGIPSIWFFMTHGYNDPNYEKDMEMLYAELCSLHSDPAYSSEDEGIEEKYNSLFHFKKEGAVPLYLWATPESVIVLLKEEADILGREYRVYAEPNRQVVP